MKKNCLWVFHDWSEWTVDKERTVQHFEYAHNTMPYKTTRHITQVRECHTCKYKQYKVRKIRV